jgi:streptogramin lyase
MRRLIALASLIDFTLTACGGQQTLVPAGRQAPSIDSTLRAIALHTHKSVRVALHIHWKAKHRVKRAHYLPATARSISFTVNGSRTQYANFPVSTIYIDAPVGNDSFFIAAWDEKNGLGNILAAANVSKQIVVGQNNVVSATLNGVISSFAIALSNPSPNAGVPATVSVNVSAFDADGNVIVGSTSDYSTPIKLTVNDSTNSGTLSLSKKVLQGPWATATLTYNGGTLNSGLPGGPTATVTASASGFGSTATAFTPKPTVYQYSIPSASNRPRYIAAGSDGNMWFTEALPGNVVARITPAGVVTEFSIPTANAVPDQIIGAADGDLWFTESGSTANKIAKITTTGTFTEYSTLFAPPPADQPMGLVDRGDGNIWYVGFGSSRVGYTSYNGSLAGETSVPTSSSQPFGIAAAPDNYLYYTEFAADKIGRIHDLFSAQSEISLTANSHPRQIVRGPDGNMWFTEYDRGLIGRLSPSSFSVTGEFPTLTPLSGPWGITVGKDGALWFTEQGDLGSTVDKIGRITTGGTVTEFSIPLTGVSAQGIAVGPDGSLWFCEPGANRVGRLVY